MILHYILTTNTFMHDKGLSRLTESWLIQKNKKPGCIIILNLGPKLVMLLTKVQLLPIKKVSNFQTLPPYAASELSLFELVSLHLNFNKASSVLDFA